MAEILAVVLFFCCFLISRRDHGLQLMGIMIGILTLGVTFLFLMTLTV